MQRRNKNSNLLFIGCGQSDLFFLNSMLDVGRWRGGGNRLFSEKPQELDVRFEKIFLIPKGKESETTEI